MLATRFEIIPTEGIVDVVNSALPIGSMVSITCLPHHGVESTVRTAIKLSELGFVAVPHIAAKCVENRGQLSGILGDCAAAGITEVFAIGGDAPRAAGVYSTGVELVRDIAELSGGSMSVGVAGYPEGHPNINGLQLMDALLEKQEFAGKIVTQMCFSAETIHTYVALLRKEGVHLPVYAGVAGAVPKAKLISLASRIGVGTSLKFLSRKGPLARKLILGERYAPEALIQELAARPGVEGIQLYTFNSLEALPQ
ncbi:methylenetetrahydrofolate reductase [Paenarthrobacter ureafaciens]|uniref:methylenetetrahydrofolate reductase n=1 Tax=Paenarthrobacter ureafaciens TaxID=37931 RepID=UPI002DB7AB6C|nr:methylenetetrahydrofolate reductase [Paenarthrobacter ureafaciens]MEC3854315.1 methylenetetrahydrofolate reductase [Paenarthrobacter ureafaciens]